MKFTIFNIDFSIHRMSRQIALSASRGSRYFDIVLLYDGLFDWHFGRIVLPPPYKGYMVGPIYFYYK